MSTNINSWKTKTLENFQIKVSDLKGVVTEDEKRRGWGLDDISMNVETGKTTITGGAEGFEIVGVLQMDSDTISVESIDCHGEGSGTFYFSIFQRILAKSKGNLTAVTVWEDGSVAKLTVTDGVIEDKEVEL